MMDDIAALALLSEEIKHIRAISDPPTDYAEAEGYRRKTDTVIDKSLTVTKQVNNYAKDIEDGLEELMNALKVSSKKVQVAIRKTLESFKVGSGQNPSKALQYIRDLQKIEENKKRLEEFIVQTQIVIAKVRDKVDCTIDDINLLKGYLKSWELEKDENYEEEKRRLEEEQRRREEEERLRKEENERKRKEEEERRRKEEEERRKREEEERLKREEEERLRVEEEERRKREAEEKRKRDEQDRKKGEEAEKRRQEDDERRRRFDEEARRKEEERLKREAEMREKKRIQRELDEKRRRLDPNNWTPVVYDRPCDAVDGDRTYHKGVCCVVSPPPDSIDREDIECNASDEVNDIIEILDDGEKIASSIVDISSAKGVLNFEVPARAYIPHCQVADPGDEIVMKVSINGGGWVTSTPIMPSPQISTKEGSRLLGVEIDKFEQVKVVVVARRKTQTIIVDRPGTSQYSVYDKNIKLFVPRDAFSSRTELRLAVRPITDDSLNSLAKENNSCENVMATSSLITLSCQKPPTMDFEIDLMKPTNISGKKTNKGRTFQLYRTREKQWKFADAEYKGKHQDVSITLPAAKEIYNLIEIELSQNASKEDAIKAAESIYDHAQKTVVRLIVKQKQSNPVFAMVHCVRREVVIPRLSELANLGYTVGPDTSREFCLKDGQLLSICCSGNIDTSSGVDGVIVLPFYTYMDSAKEEITFYVKDKYKQRDLPEYIGNLKCTVSSGPESKDSASLWARGVSFEMPLSIPKAGNIRATLKSAKVRFPPYLTALTGFLSLKLTEIKETDWMSVISTIDDKRKLQALLRSAKSKCEDNDEREICRSVLSDWMKAKPRQDDKVRPLQIALEDHGLYTLSKECLEFVEYHKDELNDTVLCDIAEQLTGDVIQTGERLDLTEKQVKKCMKDCPDSTSRQMANLLREWRQSDDAIRQSTNALDYLKQILKV